MTVGGFRCHELCLYGIRELAYQLQGNVLEMECRTLCNQDCAVAKKDSDLIYDMSCTFPSCLLCQVDTMTTFQFSGLCPGVAMDRYFILLEVGTFSSSFFLTRQSRNLHLSGEMNLIACIPHTIISGI